LAEQEPVVFRPPKRRSAEPPYSALVGDYADKLSRIRPIAHDEDERQTREDRDYGQTIFTRGVAVLPRFMTGVKK
jgi:hypothetical protein